MILVCRGNKTSAILDRLNDYKSLPNQNLLAKIDYYFTPYNRGVSFDKHMKFDQNLV